MERKEQYILMYQNDEVLFFEVTFGKINNIKIIERLAHFDKAPFGINKEKNDKDNAFCLLRFFNNHSIASPRWDYELILKYTNTKDAFELAFKGHGLSLSHHYWFKKEDENLRYEDINFFTNKWDDSFARAVLKEDYESLAHVSLNVPDIVTDGWCIKGWLCEDDGPKLYKLGIAKDHYEEPLAETLCSKLAKRMFNNNEFCEYKLKKIYGKYASVSKCLIGIDEELIPLSHVFDYDFNNLYQMRYKDKNADKEFFKRIATSSLPGLSEFFVKLSCWRSLCFVNDLHLNNLCAIRNTKTGALRLAPAFDFGGAFGSSENGRKILSNINQGTYLIVYFSYGNINPDWDYSWYNPDSLIGFEDEIKETLSKSDFYSEQLINNIIEVYHHQKSSLDDLASKTKN